MQGLGAAAGTNEATVPETTDVHEEELTEKQLGELRCSVTCSAVISYRAHLPEWTKDTPPSLRNARRAIRDGKT